MTEMPIRNFIKNKSHIDGQSIFEKVFFSNLGLKLISSELIFLSESAEEYVLGIDAFSGGFVFGTNNQIIPEKRNSKYETNLS